MVPAHKACVSKLIKPKAGKDTFPAFGLYEMDESGFFENPNDQQLGY